MQPSACPGKSVDSRHPCIGVWGTKGVQGSLTFKGLKGDMSRFLLRDTMMPIIE